jgi:FKBP-type peptidyl-prolyl cis-trans isomerase SlyD
VVVEKDRVVRLRVDMHDAQNEPLSAPSEMSYLEPEQAFGEYDASLLRVEPAERYGEGIAVGMEVEEDERLYTVTDVAGGKVVLDGNHPLAGMALRFSCVVLSVRTATEEELRRGVSLFQGG